MFGKKKQKQETLVRMRNLAQLDEGFFAHMKSKQIGRVLRYNLRFAGKPYYASWKSWRRSGNLYAPKFLFPFSLSEFLDIPEIFRLQNINFQ